MIFGFGLSNNSFNGLPIDDSWLAVYQDQGIFGDVLSGLIMLSLLSDRRVQTTRTDPGDRPLPARLLPDRVLHRDGAWARPPLTCST